MPGSPRRAALRPLSRTRRSPHGRCCRGREGTLPGWSARSSPAGVPKRHGAPDGYFTSGLGSMKSSRMTRISSWYDAMNPRSVRTVARVHSGRRRSGRRWRDPARQRRLSGHVRRFWTSTQVAHGTDTRGKLLLTQYKMWFILPIHSPFLPTQNPAS